MSKTKSNAPTPPVEDLTTCRIPGGIAHFHTKEIELSVRRSRLMDAYNIAIMPRLRELMVAQKIISPEGDELAHDPGLPGIPTGLTLEEASKTLEMTDAAAWAYLKDWSIKNHGEKVPLPISVDDMLDHYPRGVVDALVGHAAKIISRQVKDDVAAGIAGFTIEGGIDDEESPSTDLGD